MAWVAREEGSVRMMSVRMGMESFVSGSIFTGRVECLI